MLYLGQEGPRGEKGTKGDAGPIGKFISNSNNKLFIITNSV